jgi:L-fucose isomerase-like protein
MLATVLKSSIAVEVTKQIMRTFVGLKNQSVPYFDIIKRLEKLETNDKETRELLQKVVQVVSSMQNIQNEAKEGTKKIGFL